MQGIAIRILIAKFPEIKKYERSQDEKMLALGLVLNSCLPDEQATKENVKFGAMMKHKSDRVQIGLLDVFVATNRLMQLDKLFAFI